MAFSIEAIQSKAKLKEARSREFTRKVLWPELVQRDAETIIDSATDKMVNVVQSTLSKIRNVLKRTPADATLTEDAQRNESIEEVFDISELINDEGFVEVTLTKRN